LSDEQRSVDGTRIEAWASQKSFRPNHGNDDDEDGANFYGHKRNNDSLASTRDPGSQKSGLGREHQFETAIRRPGAAALQELLFKTGRSRAKHGLSYGKRQS
jgi:hypothetical protein